MTSLAIGIRCWVVLAVMAAAGTKIIEDFESSAPGRITIQESAAGSVSAKTAASPAGGRCLSLEFKRGAKGGYAYVRLPVTAELAKSAKDYDGITFKVKGDGSKTFGTIEIRANEYVNIFQAVFALDSTEWREVGIRWEEFFQMNDSVKEAGIDWAAINVFAFGSRAGWGSASFEVDDIALARIEARAGIAAPAGSEKLAKTRAKLRQGEAVKIVALGDSITFGTKVPAEKRGTALYFQVAAAGLEKAFPGARVTTVNAGEGGDTIGEGIVRTGHEVAAAKGDLVMVLLGANDAIYDLGNARVRRTMGILLDRLIETCGAEILLLGPTPASAAPGVPERYAGIYRELAREKNVAYMDLGEALRRLPEREYQEAYADGVHLSEKGHRICGESVVDYITGLAR